MGKWNNLKILFVIYLSFNFKSNSYMQTLIRFSDIEFKEASLYVHDVETIAPIEFISV